MSDIVKRQSNRPARRKAQIDQPVQPEEIQIQTEVIDAPDDLTISAIAAADAPFIEAGKAFNARFTNNYVVFEAHIRGAQQRASDLLKRNLVDPYRADETNGVSDDAD